MSGCTTVLAGLFLLAGCGDALQCPVDEYCSDDNRGLERCMLSCPQDEVSCHRNISVTPCPTALSCVDDPNMGAVCTDVTGAPCDDFTYVPNCDGDVLVVCFAQHEVHVECGTSKTCFVPGASLAQCVDKPVTSCDPTAIPVCLDEMTLQRCLGSGAGPFAVLTGTCERGCIGGAGTSAQCR